jgi:hypothetical protein
MIEINLRRNPEYVDGSDDARYFFEVDLSKYLRSGSQALIPVFWRRNDAPHPTLKEIYHVEIAGVKLEKGNLFALQKIVVEAIMGLISYGTLPYYFINLPDGADIPVYLVSEKLRTKLRDVEFSGNEIGEIWNRIAEYLVTLREIKRKEDVSVSIFLWKDLRLYPMAFVLRSGRIWIPIFSHGKGRLNYDVIGKPSEIIPVEHALDLCRKIAYELMDSRAISSIDDLKMDQISDEICDRLTEIHRKTGWVLSYYNNEKKVGIPILDASGEFLVVLKNAKRGIYIGRDLEDLKRKVEMGLGGEGGVSTGGYLTLEHRR